MNNRSFLVRLYFMTCATMLVDMSIQIAVIWQILSMTGSPIYIGLIVSIGALIPLAINRIPIFKGNLLTNKFVFSLRCVTATAFLFIAYLTNMNVIWLFFIVSILASSLMVINLNLMEKYNTTFVKANVINGEKGARYIQTAIQTGAFMGAFIGSWLLKQVGFYSFILIVSCISIFISFSYWFLHADEPFLSSNSKKEITPSENHIKQSFWPQILVIAITGLHVGAFNTLLPIYFQLFREWDATFFGAASGIAGIGALSASLFKHLKYQYVVAILLLGMGDILIIYLNEPRAAVFFGFFIGFSINTLRIHARAMILNAPINEEMTIKTISISNYFFFCLNGITPLCITLLLTFYESTAQQYGMTLALIGVGCSIVLLVNEYIRMRQESTLKLRGTKL